ncbi:Tripartite tricarboxylate transporter family receptor [compost metagenome]
MPTSTEQGLTREIEGMTPWFMWMAPAGTPKPVVELLNRHVNEILKLPEVQQPLRAAGIEPEGSTTAAATDYFLGERARITRLSQELGVSFKE